MNILSGLKYYFMNSIVCYIPFWFIRKAFYRMAGMKIGKSHILMRVTTDGWKRIEIGDGVSINQNCYIDGRGGLKIGDNASISYGSVVLSATHDKDSADFPYIEKQTVLGERTWLGVNSVVLPGAKLGEGVILAASSVAVGKEYEKYGIYSGVPAIKISDRNNDLQYDLSEWKPYFR